MENLMLKEKQINIMEQLSKLFEGIEKGKTKAEMIDLTERIILSGEIGKEQMLTDLEN